MNLYYAYFKNAFLKNSIYRIEYLLGIVNTCLQIFISCAIWKVLYGEQAEVNGVSYLMVTTNFVIAQGLGSVFSLNDFAIQHKLNDGSIALDLLKPIDLRVSLLVSDLGEIIFKVLTSFFPAVLISIFFIGVLPPVNLKNFCMFCISIFLGFLVLWSINIIVQMLSFWIMNVWSISTIKNVIVNILAGGYLPLWFMPNTIQKFIAFTPFEKIYFVPIKIYLGQIEKKDILMCYASQIIWFIVLYMLGMTLWHFGKKKIVIQGG